MDIAAVNDLDSVALNWVIIQSRFSACPFLSLFCVRVCISARRRARERARGRVVFVAVNMLCMISQLNPGIRSARLDAVGWAFDEVCRWSAWRPNNTALLSSSLAYNWCFCGSVPLRGAAKKTGNWALSLSPTGRGAILMRTGMLVHSRRKRLRISFLGRSMP